MTRTKSHRGAGDQRASIASHFKVVEDLPMKSLNDPLPPYHGFCVPPPEEIARDGASNNDSGGGGGGLQYYKIDLSQLKLINQQNHQKSTELNKRKTTRLGDDDAGTTRDLNMGSNKRFFPMENGNNEELYPSVSHGTRNLLREVANIRHQYQNKTANEVAARLPEELISKPRPKKVRKMKAVNPVIIKDTNVEQQEPELSKSIEVRSQNVTSQSQKTTTSKRRFVTHVSDINFGLSTTPVFKSQDLDSSTKEVTMKSDSPREKSNFAIEEGSLQKLEETITDQQNTKNTNDDDGPKNQTYIADERNNDESNPAAPSIAKNSWRKNMKKEDPTRETIVSNKVEAPKEPTIANKISKMSTDLHKKPWQANMKKPIATPLAVESTKNALEKSMKTTENTTQDNNIQIKKSQSKPWRSHMKKALTENQDYNKEANRKVGLTTTKTVEESIACHTRQARAPDDHERLRNFMKLRRQKTKSELKAKKEEHQQYKDKVLKGLLELDMLRSQQRQQESKQHPPESQDDLIHRLRKEEETDELKRLLTELTDEMRSKYFQQNPTHSSTMTKSTSNSAPNVDHTDHIDIVTENHEPKSLQAKETADKYKQLRPNQHYLSPDSNFVSTPIVSSSAREKNIGQEEHSYKAYSNPSVAVSLKNESQVEKLRKTQNQVLQSLKKTCNIRTTEELAASSVEIHLAAPDIVMPYVSSNTSFANSKMVLQDAGTADEYNFMSSAKRKFAEAQTNKYESETSKSVALSDEKSIIALSEGPITSDDSPNDLEDEGVNGNNEDLVPVRDLNTQHASNVERVPTVLHLRFQAELNQMESIQEAERQLNQLNEIRTVVDARNDAATMASYAKAMANQHQEHGHEPATSSKRREKYTETRSQFEQRMKKELQDLFNSRMAELLKGQMEATRMTVEAAEKLANLKDHHYHRHSSSNKTSRRESYHGTKSSKNAQTSTSFGTTTSKKTTSVPGEDIVTMISKAESNIPELLSAVEATDRSGKEIHKSIQSAIRELSTADDISRGSNITEEIAAELQTDDDYSISKKSVALSCSEESSSRSPNGKRHFLEEQASSYSSRKRMLKKQERIINEKYCQTLTKLKSKKEEAIKNNDNVRYQSVCQKEKNARKKFREQKEELAKLKHSLKVAEHERKFSKKDLNKTTTTTTTDIDQGGEEDVSTASQVSEDLSHHTDETLTQSNLLPKKSKMDTFKKQLGAATLKTPLSPKRNVETLGARQRKRHSSADESEDSMVSVFSSQGGGDTTMSSTGGDQSDLEIRVNALQDELEKRMKTAAKLKRDQKTAKRERLKVKEDTLKKQIEVYDQLILQTKADIEATASSPTSSSSSSAVKIVQPQIKIPKQQSNYEPPPSPTPSNSSLVQEAENTSQHSISLDDSNSTDTIIASPQKPLTPAAVEEEVPPIWPQIQSAEPPSETTGNNNYSDDFTSSNNSITSNIPEGTIEDYSNVPSPAPISQGQRKALKVSEKTVDTICGELLEHLIKDAISHVKKPTAPQSKEVPTNIIDQKSTSVSPTRRPPQELMHTTFDISSESSEEDALPSKEPLKAIENVVPMESKLDPVEDNATTTTNTDGDFIDDDFGLSIKREWEQLRQQQLRIEEEINSIQREKIPPPPPYTPPASPPIVELRTPKPLVAPKEDPCILVPSTKDKLPDLIKAMTEKLIKNRSQVSNIYIEKSFEDQCLSMLINDKSEANDEDTKKHQRIFIRFIFDLVKDTISDIYKVEMDKQNPPWMIQKPLTKNLLTLSRNENSIVDLIIREVMVAFNHEKRSQKENMIIRWSQKKRDRVDQVLVRELHAEEPSWTNYEEDEAQVKSDLAQVIMDTLINDTVIAFKSIMQLEK